MVRRIALLTVCLWLGSAAAAFAQNDRRMFAGVLLGVSTLSADGREVTMPPSVNVSLYAPENGIALNVFAGVHLAQYLSLQMNYMWNRNELGLFSSFASAESGGFYDQRRTSVEHAVVFDGLIYFRNLNSSIRPFLGTGFALLRFVSEAEPHAVSVNLDPPGRFASNRVALRSAVGIDLRVGSRISVRYTFSETISTNPISPHLMPQGERRLANFQNLAGVTWDF